MLIENDALLTEKSMDSPRTSPAMPILFGAPSFGTRPGGGSNVVNRLGSLLDGAQHISYADERTSA